MLRFLVSRWRNRQPHLASTTRRRQYPRACKRAHSLWGNVDSLHSCQELRWQSAPKRAIDTVAVARLASTGKRWLQTGHVHWLRAPDRHRDGDPEAFGWCDGVREMHANAEMVIRNSSAWNDTNVKGRLIRSRWTGEIRAAATSGLG